MRQRSKAELLNVYKTYRTIKLDEQNDSILTNTTGLWRFKVEWAIVMLEQEHFSRNDVLDMFAVLDEYDNLWTIDNEEELRQRIIDKNCDIFPKNMFKRNNRKKDVVNATVDNMLYYNTRRATNMLLIMMNWLIDNKGYGKKRLERDLQLIDLMDNYGMETVYKWSEALRNEHGLIIELSEEEAPEGARVV